MRDTLQIQYVSIDKSEFQISPGDIQQLLGESLPVLDTHTSELVEQYIGECMQISSPAGAFLHIEALKADSSEVIQIPGITFHTGKIIQKMIQNSESYALFIVTTGPQAEQMARSLLNEGNYLEGYIVDLVASAMVDQAADQVQQEVRSLAELQGLCITNRYSPGYCSWNVEEQQKLFSLFPEGCCGISLSDSSLMDPIKSISGIIGIGAKVSYQEYTCAICPMCNCHFRRVNDQ